MQNLLLLLERFFSTLLTIDYLKVIYNEGCRHHTTTKFDHSTSNKFYHTFEYLTKFEVQFFHTLILLMNCINEIPLLDDTP